MWTKFIVERKKKKVTEMELGILFLPGGKKFKCTLKELLNAFWRSFGSF